MTLPRPAWPALLALVGLALARPAPVPRPPTRDATAEQAESAAPPAPPAHFRVRATLLHRLRADRWHADGYRGQGVTVAVLDSGFRGWKRYLGSALPDHVETRSFRPDGDLEAKDSQHGILCGEVVHALAPDAKLLFANWDGDDPATFVAAVRWARERGARAVTCSVIMPCWSDGEGGGPVHVALAPVVGSGWEAGDVLCFACAGNTAQRHWSGPFRDAGDGLHLWRSDLKDNVVTAWGDGLMSIELCWPAGAGYALQVLDPATGQEVARAAPRSAADPRCAVVRFVSRPKARYAVRVRLTAGQPGPFHLAVLGGWLDQYSERGSIPFPGDGPEWLAVGAWEEDRRAAYSSCGPNSPLPKPDFVAPVPFPSAWRPKPFDGTSAAAPQAAGLAALLWSRNPAWPADRVRFVLRASAQDLLTPGHDWETGYGLLRLPSD
jgi:hypothetical protein